MSLSKTLVSLGTWIEKHFPEKLTAAEVNARYADMESAVAEAARRAQHANETNIGLQVRVAELEKQCATFTSDMNKTKIMLLTQRQTAGR